MSKLVQAFLSGAFFTFFLDFFLFLGMKLNYIDYYKIDLYYNPFFADNQNVFVYLFFTILFGLLITYIENTKLSLIVIGGLLLLSLTMLIEPIGHKVASILFMQKNVSLQTSRFVYKGDIYYDGRTTITFYDNEIKKILTLKKEDLI
ncbi:MAG: hypothetical protein ACI9TV_001282 [Sulfurimonas sp.]|jgi:hypothetical protein|uniref:hypothetical protein n=1 Tax=Sulfurimonas sp. TaxID=2022749 RepID=UPI0039E3E8A7